MPTPPVRALPDVVDVAVIGYGYWGPNLVRNLAGLDTCNLRAICDLLPAARARATEKYPAVPTTDALAPLLADETIRAVVVATPAATHRALVLQALEAGKHVLVEKPLATSVADAREMVAAAEKRRLVLGVGHTFLHTGAVRAAREQVQKGAIGTVLSVTSRRENLGLHRPDANVIWDLAPHDVSILTYVQGTRVVRAAAQGAESLIPGSVDVAALTLEMETGVRCFVHISWMSARKVREMAWVGTTGTLVYDDMERIEKLRILDRGADVIHGDDGRREVTYREGTPAAVPLDETEALKRLCANFVDAVAGRGSLEITGRDGLRVVAVLEAVERSLKEGGRMEEVEDV
jgi:predicted dehydrogenase